MATAVGTIQCPNCGASARAGTRFCTKCGGSMAGAAATPAPSRAPAPSRRTPESSTTPAPATTGKKTGFNVWWIIIPTAFFAFLSRQIIPIAIVAALGAFLWWLRANPQSLAGNPSLAKLQPYAPWAAGLQLPVVFVGLGGSPIAVAVLGVAVFFIVRNPMRLVALLEPWWKFQTSIPMGFRKPLAFAVPFAFGYFFGINAGGQEWTVTLISISLGVVVAFLILFTPPESLRRNALAAMSPGRAG